MPSSCRSKQAILRGLRPNHQQKIIFSVCSSHCIYCDIWQLADLIYTRLPLSHKYGDASSPVSRSSRASSPTHRETFDWETSESMIEAQFQTQRARLASILSICTVEGAEESEGLRVAHTRCLSTVRELLYQERVLEDTIVRSRQTAQAQRSESRYTGQNCGPTNTDYYYCPSERRPSRVGMAM